MFFSFYVFFPKKCFLSIFSDFLFMFCFFQKKKIFFLVFIFLFMSFYHLFILNPIPNPVGLCTHHIPFTSIWFTIKLELSEIDCLHIDVSNAIMKRKNNDIFMEHQLPNAGDLDPIADLQTQVISITTPKYLEPDTSL